MPCVWFILFTKGSLCMRKEKVLYNRLYEALYGYMNSALLWYKFFSGTWKKIGFTLSPYKACEANQILDEMQCTTTWYVVQAFPHETR